MRCTTAPWHLAVLASWIVAVAACISPDNLPSTLSSIQRATVYEAVIVHRRANDLFASGRIRDAIWVGLKALEMLKAALGDDHPYIVVPLRSLAVFLQSNGDYPQAERLFANVLERQEGLLEQDDVTIASSLDDLAGLYTQWGAYTKAARLLARALAIRERSLSPDDPSIVESLNNLAVAYERQGKYGLAEPLYERALALARRVLGAEHADVARSLDGLAMLYVAQGAYVRAEPLLMQALEIRTGLVTEVQRFGPIISKSRFWMLGGITGYLLSSLSNLDQLYSDSMPNAAPLVARTADIYDTALRAAQADVDKTVDHITALHVASGNYQRAEPLLQRVLADREKAGAPRRADLANSLNDLAQLYQTQGAYAKAEPLLRRVLEIRTASLGATHPDVGRSLNNLALLYLAQRTYTKAQPLLEQALNVLEHARGGAPSDLARCLNNLALLHHLRGDLKTAEPLYLRSIAALSQLPGSGYPDAIRYLTNLAALYHANGLYWKAEPLLRRAAELRESRLDAELAWLPAPRKRALMALVQQETEALVSLHIESSPLSATAFDLALTAVLRRKGLALESLLEGQATLRANLTPEIRSLLDRLTAQHAALTALQRDLRDAAAPAAHDAAVAVIAARIERLESELSAASAARQTDSPPVTLAQIQAALPPAAALVEYVRYHRFDPRPDQPRWHEARYAAYIVTRRGPPRWVALGEAAVIDEGIAAMQAEMHRHADPVAAQAALERLDTQLIEPLRDRLADVSHLIIAPDGALNLVPFEALRDSQGRYELENRLVSYVTSGRDLLSRGQRRPPRERSTIVAAPDYGPGPTFAPLAGAAAEAAEVAARFVEPRVLQGPRATKAALSSLRGPSVLHVATHGFFALDPPAATAVAAPAEPFERGMDVHGVLEPRFVAADDDPVQALDHAGLALAGANVNAEGTATAREIANYDWWGTELVVLSACETGVGAAPSGDGVYGLRRALALAGAASQVVSLWNVSDRSVRLLMREFYRELARGTGRAEALRRAKRWMLQQPGLSHPYFWAAFIPAGDWTPLAKDAGLKPSDAQPAGARP